MLGVVLCFLHFAQDTSVFFNFLGSRLGKIFGWVNEALHVSAAVANYANLLIRSKPKLRQQLEHHPSATLTRGNRFDYFRIYLLRVHWEALEHRMH